MTSILNVSSDDNVIGQLSDLQGFWSDSVPLDKLIIERKRCPKCKNFLVYNGLSNATVYLALGICFSCEFAKLFWKEPSVLAEIKSKFSAKSKQKKAA